MYRKLVFNDDVYVERLKFCDDTIQQMSEENCQAHSQVYRLQSFRIFQQVISPLLPSEKGRGVHTQLLRLLNLNLVDEPKGMSGRGESV